ncbi:RNA 2'-phosphotransferase [Asaia sp. HN010]|uniref:RNA 2'-phosphotransferase n=1 Tax=Asaia sp. HN010 TaxID=3081233 RepID=UPI003016B65B
MDDNKVSRFLSLVLRHEPEKIGITLDNAGWANIDELLRSASEVGYSLDRPRLLKIIEKNDKQRFTLSSDGHCIRAAQGHSLAIDLGIPTSIPPKNCGMAQQRRISNLL